LYGKDVYVCFVDLEKAYDRVPWEKQWEYCGSTMSPSCHCTPAQKFLSVAAALSHNRLPWTLNFDKSVLSPLQAFNTHLVSFQLRAIKLEWKSALKKRGAMPHSVQFIPIANGRWGALTACTIVCQLFRSQQFLKQCSWLKPVHE